jgi:hypothetical protein
MPSSLVNIGGGLTGSNSVLGLPILGENAAAGLGELGEKELRIVLLPALSTHFLCLSHHICIHLQKSSTVPVLLDFSIIAEELSAVSCELLHTTNQLYFFL